MTLRTVILHNIITTYKTALFNELSKKIPSLEIVYIAQTETRRDWTIDKESLKHSYSTLFYGALDKQSKWKIFRSTWQKLNELDPDLLVVSDYSNIYGWSSMLWGKRNKKPMLFWFDSTWEDKQRTYLIEKIKQLFIKQFAGGIAPGTRTRQYFHKLGMDDSKVYTTGYAVDNSYFQSEHSRLHRIRKKLIESLKVKSKNLLFVGRFAAEKNLMLLLQAFKDAYSINADWGLILVGDGPDKSLLQEFINQNNLDKHVFIPGFVDHDELVKYYTVSDIFVLPSISEPWGLVVNEAMNCSLPVVVSTICGCAPDLVENGKNGYLFDPYDLNGFSDLLKQIMTTTDSLRKMGKSSFEKIQNHSPEKVAANLYSILSLFLNDQ
jgi:glycosyltransferase involved in cell wall biosynthesis